MAEIINLILFIVLILLTARFSLWLVKRIGLIVKLSSLKKQCGAKIRFQRFPFLPTSFMSKKADISVEIRDTVYLIRLYSGGGGTKFVHFASPTYSVRYSKLRTGRLVVNTRFRARIIDTSAGSFTIGSKVFVMPDFPIPNDDSLYGKRTEKIILFNPAPNEVSYVTEEKTTIKIAFTGDELYGMKVFTASSFVAYADRETRKNDEFMYF